MTHINVVFILHNEFTIFSIPSEFNERLDKSKINNNTRDDEDILCTYELTQVVQAFLL